MWPREFKIKIDVLCDWKIQIKITNHQPALESKWITTTINTKKQENNKSKRTWIKTKVQVANKIPNPLVIIKSGTKTWKRHRIIHRYERKTEGKGLLYPWTRFFKRTHARHILQTLKRKRDTQEILWMHSRLTAAPTVTYQAVRERRQQQYSINAIFASDSGLPKTFNTVREVRHERRHA